MAQNATHTGDDKLIFALAAGVIEQEAAEQAGPGKQTEEPTGDRRWADAGFRRAALEAQDRMFDSTRGQLAGLTGKAVATLERLMESDKPAVALGAAKVVLELGPRLREATRFEERINRMEDQADENASENQTPEGEGADFQRDVSRARGWLFGSAVGRLAGLASKAVGILERLMESEQPSVARRAAKAVLLLGPRLRESTELKERLSRLEEADNG